MALKDGRGFLKDPRKPIVALLLLVAITLASGQEFEGTKEKKLDLDIYLYDTGSALVTGYVDDPMNLTFLRSVQYAALYDQYSSNYRYENDTHRLNAWTDALTSKQGENWSMMFSCDGFYNEYHVVFHLPDRLRLGRVNSSTGPNYLVSASNDSLIVEAQGYDVHDPAISIEYRQPLNGEVNEPDGNVSDNDNSNGNIAGSDNVRFNQAYLLLILIAALAIGGLIIFIVRRRATSPKIKSSIPETEIAKIEEASSPSNPAVSEVKAEDLPGDDQVLDALPPEFDQLADASEEDGKPEETPLIEEGPRKETIMSSEMIAVMDALTPRERSIVEALIKRGGRMTQAEIRYETNLPRSTLTTILISLERRGLITKREWGRTNVVELSEKYLFGK